jgi:hypothetical protein
MSNPLTQKYNDKYHAVFTAVDIPRNCNYSSPNAHLEPISLNLLAFNVCERFCRDVITCLI